ncbi:MAG: class I SAM-dependent methyltransferase [Planctomycetaceae bacterium]|nr:class I SAM-dependent methyltransferase [Planctomycetaceae bacterium]
MPDDGYALLDFGDGRRLERFGRFVLDRPSPAAETFDRENKALWSSTDARFEGRDQEKGQWTLARPLPDHWTLADGPLRFELKRTEFGHVGLFPEQSENWKWLLSLPSIFRKGAVGEGESPADHRPKVLNLFAYTGGSSLAAAAAGAEVVHVDAAKNILAWARRNAELSGLAQAPIRWIAEDALKFAKRELRRGNRYDAVILDPPSYGHGPHGEVWRLSKHLPRLLSLCAELTADRLQFILLTCHTPGFDTATLRDMLRDAIGPAGQISARQLSLRSVSGRELPSGAVARWEKRDDTTQRP